MSEPWVVVGGGFRGIIGAYLLASRDDEVTVVEAGAALGGGTPAPWHGFHLDHGCHLFDNSDDRTTAILLDLLGDNVAPMTVRYASVTNGVKTEGIALPDLGTYGETAASQILHELTEAAGRTPPPPGNLQEILDARFGPTAGRYLADVCHKMYRIEPAGLDAPAFRLSPFRRIKFLPDAAAETLKRDPAFDDRIASSSQADPMRFARAHAGAYTHRHFYPQRHGIHGFAESAAGRLRELGVSVQLGQGVTRLELSGGGAGVVLADGRTIRADRVLWALDTGTLERVLLRGTTVATHVHGVPMILHYFALPASDAAPLTYIQDYDAGSYAFRMSVPGSYLGASGPLTYICCEVPTDVGSPEWQNADTGAARAWAQVRRYGLARSEQPLEALTVTTPRSYWMPRVGYTQARDAVAAALRHVPRLVYTDDLVFLRSSIVASLLQALDA